MCVVAALQSPIEYQKEKSGGGGGGSSSLTRNRSSSGNRPAASSHSRPSSAVGLGDKESERGRSQMKVSTSNGGSSCFDSRVSSGFVASCGGGVLVLRHDYNSVVLPQTAAVSESGIRALPALAFLSRSNSGPPQVQRRSSRG